MPFEIVLRPFGFGMKIKYREGKPAINIRVEGPEGKRRILSLLGHRCGKNFNS
ncbi:MAG: hypothetical protein AOA66_0754 [Candidatus Bathyarchaeota archaeon BA2]|nr:MAG: hypothetical protein AOA66_0754 [Candidatus Bathyarchaeota archaeon BA2]